MVQGSETLRSEAGQISFHGRVFDRRGLFLPLPAPEIIAARLAFPVDWAGATARMGNVIDVLRYRKFSGPELVQEIGAGYDFENETTLEMTAALIARRGDFLTEHGLRDNYTKYSMMETAANIDIGKTWGWIKDYKRDSYYKAELDAIRQIRDGLMLLKSLARMTA